MKTRSFLLMLFFTCPALYAQTSTGIAVQGIARDANKAALVAQTLSFTFTISGTPSGGSSKEYYKESKDLVTDAFGVFSHIIGTGTPSGGSTFAGVAFGEAHMNLKVEIAGVATPLLDGPMQYAPYSKSADNGVPIGGVIMWSGQIGKIPPGWALCDGTNNTPDLRGRFIVGYDGSDADYNAIGKLGGEKKHTLAANEMPSHNHGGTATTSDNGSHRHELWSGIGNGSLAVSNAPQIGFGAFTGTYVNGTWASRGTDYINDGGNHNHTVTISSEGQGLAHENRPPYYALAYIMRVQ